MKPTVWTLIAQGIKTAGRSWRGIGIWLLGSLLWLGVWTLMLNTTGFPKEAFEEIPREVARGPALIAPAPLDLEQAEEVEVDEPELSEEEARAIMEERAELTWEWFRRAWVSVVLIAMLGLAGWAWLIGGQLGYLKAQLDGRGSITTFIQTGIARLSTVLQTVGVSFGVGLVALLGLSVILVLVTAIGGQGVFGFFLVSLASISGVVALIWLGVSLAFWMIAVVVDSLGPIEGLKASFLAVRGHWWHTFRLVALWMLIGIVLGVLIGLIVWPVGRVAQDAGSALRMLLEMVANVFVGFALNASLIAWYRHLKSPISTSESESTRPTDA